MVRERSYGFRFQSSEYRVESLEDEAGEAQGGRGKESGPGIGGCSGRGRRCGGECGAFGACGAFRACGRPAGFLLSDGGGG